MEAGNPSPVWALLILAPAIILGIGQLICLVRVIVEMFKRGETGMGIVCIALSLCTGIGGLIAFVYGWVKSSQWGLRTVMLVWTGCIVLQLVLVVVALIAGVLSGPILFQPAPAVGM
ncbi:MAG TPA: hypothetical protein VN699_18925 [Pirellulales bacterium]|nr:hypothetical protein [Pirellulales bacterium]